VKKGKNMKKIFKVLLWIGILQAAFYLIKKFCPVYNEFLNYDTNELIDKPEK